MQVDGQEGSSGSYTSNNILLLRLRTVAWRWLSTAEVGIYKRKQESKEKKKEDTPSTKKNRKFLDLKISINFSMKL